MAEKNPQLAILYSTTRQWNPGDEIIRYGCRNLIEEFGIRHNSVIWNRHPGIQPYNPSLDNSFDVERHSFAGIDYVVFAGSPEWSGGRVEKLNDLIIQNNKKCLYIGIGAGRHDSHEDSGFEVLRNHADIAICRDQTALDLVQNKLGIEKSHCLPCPAMFHSGRTMIEQKEKVERISIVFQAVSTMMQEVTEEQRELLISLFENLSKKYEVNFVCHYIDEYMEASEFLPQSVIRYSYDAAYFREAYADADLVIGARVHGAISALGLGIPAILLGTQGNVRRTATAKPYHPYLLTPQDSIDEIEKIIADLNPREHMKGFKEFKDGVRDSYLELLQQTSLKELVEAQKAKSPQLSGLRTYEPMKITFPEPLPNEIIHIETPIQKATRFMKATARKALPGLYDQLRRKKHARLGTESS